MHDWASSPFIVPLGFFAAWFGIVAIRVSTNYKIRKLRSQERLAAIEKGIPLPNDLADDHGHGEWGHEFARRYADPAHRLSRLRTGGIVCVAVGIGLTFFFLVESAVLHNLHVLSGAGVGLIPLAIGIGLLIDTRLQAKSLPASAPSQQPAAPPAFPRQ